MTTTALLPLAPEFLSRDIHVDHCQTESSQAARDWYAERDDVVVMLVPRQREED